jgi:hypothetical protein
MDRLAQRVDRLIDETAVQNLQHIYGYYLDRKMWDDVVDLFTDDGTFETGQQGVYEGKRISSARWSALWSVAFASRRAV